MLDCDLKVISFLYFFYYLFRDMRCGSNVKNNVFWGGVKFNKLFCCVVLVVYECVDDIVFLVKFFCKISGMIKGRKG